LFFWKKNNQITRIERGNKISNRSEWTGDPGNREIEF
jgi:hypothetical protein